MSIGLTTVVLFAVFGILLFLSCPISVSIIIASIVTAISSLSWDQITFITMQKMNSGVESFSLLAIPLFILAGNIMNNAVSPDALSTLPSCLWAGFQVPGPRPTLWATCSLARCPVHPWQLHPPWAAVSIPSRRTRATTLPLPRPSTLPRLPPDS